MEEHRLKRKLNELIHSHNEEVENLRAEITIVSDHLRFQNAETSHTIRKHMDRQAIEHEELVLRVERLETTMKSFSLLIQQLFQKQ